MSIRKSLTRRIIEQARAAFADGKPDEQNTRATLEEHHLRSRAVTRRVPPRPAMGRRSR